MRKLLIFLSLIIISTQTIKANDGLKLQWPKEITKNKTTITLYQPQLESFKNNILEGRMALSVKQGKEDIVFGALWFQARMQTNLEDRTLVLEKINITKIHFPGLEDSSKLNKLSNLLIEEVETADVIMSLDRILAEIKDLDNQTNISSKLNNTPPDIYFRTKYSVMVSIDGKPILKDIEGENFQYVLNTPFFIVKDSKGIYYIKGGKFWYKSHEISTAYAETKKAPSNIEKFAKENVQDNGSDSISKTITEVPELIVVTKPSELILSDGEPDYATIEGTNLLFVSNSENDIIMDINSQNHYVLIAGRWFYSKSLNDGDWKFAEPEDLPKDFSKIPKGSVISDVRANVPGTEEAQDALLEQSIPQTATVDRKTAKVDVQWDGDPKFEKIENTDVSVGKNTDKTVLLIKKKYYCVDDAIWFISDSPKGPWAVSDVRPGEVDQIPPESEAYNVKYVYIYESTPEVVYVGYLPGYTYSYAYGGCIVYGTGYVYQPWYGHYYYPRPVTFGYGVHYNPYTGWGFTIGFSYGWVGWGFHPHRGAYWGPRGYHNGYRHGYNRGYHNGYRHGDSRGYASGYRAGNRNSNVYNKRPAGVRTANHVRPVNSNRNLNNKARPSTKPNNIYSDKKGNVYQRKQDGNWENKSNNKATRQVSQKPANRQTRESTKSNTQPRTTQQRQTRQTPQMSNQQKQNMNRSYQNRSTGNRNFNQSRSSGGASRRVGAAGGGGRGR